MRIHRLLLSFAALLCRLSYGSTAQAGDLSISSAVVNPSGSATLGVALTASGTPSAGLQWTINYSPTLISGISITPGPAASAALKTLSCASGSGAATCILTGLNTNGILSGVMANVNATIAPGTTSASIQISNPIAADPDGNGLDLTSAVGGTIAVPTLAPLTCSATTLTAGLTSTCTITLTQPAPAGGSVVTLASNGGLLTVPASVTVPAGTKTATFIATAGITILSNQIGVVTATFGGSSQTATINLDILATGLVSALACSPASLSPGAVGSCTVTLNQAAPILGSSVALASNNNSLTVPSSATVVAGASTATFNATAAATIASNQSATVTAAIGSSSKTAAINLVAPALVSALMAQAFSEGSGTTTADTSGNGVTGTLQGATWTTSGKYGNALAFDGSTAYVDLGNPAVLQLTGSMTLSAWVFPTVNPSNDGQIVAKSSDGDGWQLKTTPDTGVRTFGIAVSNGTTDIQRYSKTVIKLNTWYYVAGVYDATAGTLDIYVNGVLDNGSLSGTVPATQHNSTFKAKIGRRTGGYLFAGTIDEVRVYGAALTQAQIQADMTAPITAPVSGLVDTQPPTVPGTLTASAVSTSQVNLSWTASTDNIDVAGYRLERCQGAGCSNFAQIASPDGSATTYNDTGLAIGASYSYRMRAVDAAANLSAYSSTATAVTSAPDSQPPTAPGALMTTTSGTQINLSWTRSTDNVGVAGYRVERCQGAGCSNFAQIASLNGSTTTYNDSGLSLSVSYSYRVRATDAAANLGPYSNTATSTLGDTQTPTTPGTLTTTASGTSQVNLSWVASTDNVGVTGYLVERCQGATCTTFAPIATPSATTYDDTGLAANTAYTYRVRATDAAGNFSAWSNTSGATTLAAVTGIVTEYPFSEGSGTTTADTSDNAVTGTLQGATWTTSGKYGNALSFNGTSAYVDLGNPAALQLTGSMTLSAWVFPTVNPSDDGEIIAKSSNSDGWQLKTTPDTGVRTFAIAVSDGTTGIQRYSQTVITLNTWYYVAGVYNAAARTLDIYVDGVLDNGNLSGTVPATQHNSTVNANIGRRTGGYLFGGMIDEVRVYNTTLTRMQIKSDMTAPIDGPGNHAITAITETLASDVSAPAANTIVVDSSRRGNLPASSAPANTVSSLHCSPKAITAGSTFTCELFVKGVQSVKVELRSSSEQLRIPRVVTTRPNQSSLTFQAQSNPVSKQQPVTLTATLGAATVEDTVLVVAPPGPVLQVPERQLARSESLLSFTVRAADPGDLPVHLEASAIPAGASLAPLTGVFEWSPRASQAGTYKVRFTATNVVGQSSTADVELEVDAGIPVLNEPASSCSPGAIDSLNGKWLAAPGSHFSDPSGSSLDLAGTRVMVNGQAAPVVYSSEDRVSFLCPSGLTAGTPLSVQVASSFGASQPMTIRMEDAVPTILSLVDSRLNQGLISFYLMNDLVMERNFRVPSHPAQPGDQIVIRATGLGPAADSLSGRVLVKLSDVYVAVESVQAVAGLPGIYEIRVCVPAAMTFGAVPIQLQMTNPDGHQLTSNSVTAVFEAVRQ
jgi:uncharacterized protein (TIGR03437 family)